MQTDTPAAIDRVSSILEAACRVVVRDGAHGLRMAAVAQEAGVSKALVHYYFSTRQELLRNAFAFSEERWQDAVSDEISSLGTGAERLRRLLLSSVEPDLAFSEQRALWNEVWSSLRSDDELRPLVERSYRAWLDRVVGLIDHGRADGSIPAHVDAGTAGWRLAAAADGLDSLLYLGLADRELVRELMHGCLTRETRRRMTDVLVLGAGLAGLAAARDLSHGGADVTVLEARERVGGRVEQIQVGGGRPAQLGGEVVGPFHTAYLGLVEELGLTLEPSYVAAMGLTTYDLYEGVERADAWPFRHPEQRADYDRVERLYGALAATVDPDDPWSHADAPRLDGVSTGTWLRSVDAHPAVIRALETGALSLAGGSIECTSLLAELRKSALAREEGFYGHDRWETLQVSEGSAEVAERVAAELGDRIRCATVVASVSVAASRCRVRLETGEELTATAVVSALPVGVLQEIPLDGVAPDRVASLRAQRMALAAKVVTVFDRSVWQDVGANGLAEGERLLGSTWPQHAGVLSALVPPERIALLLATPDEHRPALVHDELERMYGPGARESREMHIRSWATDPYARGYVTHWRTGDVLRVGALHGTHAPPFYVCGSDQWVAGYMEGAVRTGQAAAAAVLSA